MFKWFRQNSFPMEQTVSIEENTEIFLQDFERLVKTKNIIIINNFIKFMANSVQGDLLTKCIYNNRNYSLSSNIENSFLVGMKCEVDNEYNVCINVATTPLLSCIWKHDSIINCLRDINKWENNLFDGITYLKNIRAYQIKTLGLVIVRNGNHSANSAIIHGEGEIIVGTIIDISSALNKYKFNGKEYIDLSTNEKVYNKYMKNNSEPFTYILGLMFEMTKILKKYDYQGEKINKIEMS